MKIPIGPGELWRGNCLELMRDIPDASVDMILADLPYGTTACAWDTIIPFEPLWREYWRILIPRSAIVLTASQPFTSALIMSQIERFKYEWIWHKSNATLFVHAKNRPLNTHESVCVFSNGFVIHASQSEKRMSYFPQMTEGEPYSRRRGGGGSIGQGMRSSWIHDVTDSDGERYPRSIIAFDNNAEQASKIHPTQKPVPLFEYLIRTYTEPGALILDNVSGSGTTAIAAINTSRRFLCIEQDPTYWQRSLERVWAALYV